MANAKSQPSVSIIVSAYNWSTALRCALRSIQLQTVRDFEVLVVGDGCTDDSEAVVSSFDDRRFRWHNLARNHGSQFAPNNYGLENASADWVAYLGQDDVWYPTHLEACWRAARAKEADFVTSVMVLYGPPESGFRAVSGVFVDEAYSHRDFTPPSSVMHRRALVDRVGPWKSPDQAEVPVDCDFFKSIAESGARIASTDELTVFKFNAAWRRDSYRLKDTADQEAMLARIESGVDFRQEELLGVIHAVVADKFAAIEMPRPAAAGTYHQWTRRYKGAEKSFAEREMRSLERAQRFGLRDDVAFEWHGEETDPQHGSFRWTGLLTRSSVSLPVLFDKELTFRMHIIGAIDPAVLTSLRIFVQDREVSFDSETTPGNTQLLTWASSPDPASDPNEPLRIKLQTSRTRRPRDLGINEDRRWLGVAVNWIEIGPAAGQSDQQPGS
jgi:glycosyltransferase involved in cell wall biosynthesis